MHTLLTTYMASIPNLLYPFWFSRIHRERIKTENFEGKMREYWTSLALFLGVSASCQTLLQTVFPPELRFATVKFFNQIFHCFSLCCYFDITKINGVTTNELYNTVQLCLSSSVSIIGNRLSLTRALNSSGFTFGCVNNDSIMDTFNGVNVLWEHVVIQRQAQTFSWRPLPDEKRGFTLRIKKKDKSLILDSYLDYIMEKANEIRRRKTGKEYRRRPRRIVSCLLDAIDSFTYSRRDVLYFWVCVEVCSSSSAIHSGT